MSKDLKQLLLSMLKVGTIGYGGGTALIPVIEKEVSNKLVTNEEYDSYTLIASLTPGALPVEIAGLIGKKIGKGLGMILSSLSMTIPGILLMLIILSIISVSSDQILTQINFISVGITAFITLLLISYVKNTITSNKKDWKIIVIVILSIFLLTSSKTFIKIFQLNTTPLLNLSTIDVLLVSLFIICFTNCKLRTPKGIFSLFVCVLYLFLSLSIINLPILRNIITVIMIICIFYSLFVNFKSANVKTSNKSNILHYIIICVLFSVVLSLPLLIIIGFNSISFFNKGWISSIMSFGGGDAYLTVAEGLFVSSGIISDNLFYGLLVPVVNVLPGSILCKTLTGIAYEIGYLVNGSVLEGVLASLSGIGISISASCLVVCLLQAVYIKFERIELFINIKKWIRPIVSGLLLSVLLSLFYQNIKLGITYNNNYIFLIVMVFIFLVLFLLNKKIKTSSVALIIISILLSLILCNCLIIILQ